MRNGELSRNATSEIKPVDSYEVTSRRKSERNYDTGL